MGFCRRADRGTRGPAVRRLLGTGMNPSDLALFTTSELIDELLRRKTFLGVVIHAQDELKAPAWQGTQVFKVRHNANLSAAEAGRLLDVIAEHMIEVE